MCARRPRSTCLDPRALIYSVSPSYTFRCPGFSGRPHYPHAFGEPSPTFFSASGPSPLLSLSLPPVPVKVIREVFSVVEMKVAMTKG